MPYCSLGQGDMMEEFDVTVAETFSLEIGAAKHDAADHPRCSRRAGPRFSLWQLLAVCTIVCVLLALAGAVGAFVAGLAAGLYFASLGVSLLRIENPFGGGLIGWILAVIALPFACLASFWATGDVSDQLLLTCLFIYPTAGYVAGYIRALVSQLPEG